MGLKDNLHYWQLSLDHPETLGEEMYSHDEVIIECEQFLSSVDGLRSLLRAYCAFRKSCTKEGKSSCTTETMNSIVKIIDMVLRRTKNVQHTEFVAYWKCLDLSYSVYKKLDDAQRMEQLRVALDRYCEKRIDLYERLGLTHVISQALYDATSSRTMGKSGVRKLEYLLEKASTKEVVEVKSLDDFLSTPEPCMFLPRGESFGKLMEKFDAKFSFGKAHQGKIPDLVVKIHDFVFVIEAKHIKEPGGAQDKQIGELIDFVSQTEHESCPVRYVAFLDGPYLNLLAEAKQVARGQVARGNETQTEKNEIKSKLNEQLESIEDALNKHKRSYFVNTEGMLRLLMDALNSDTSTEEGF